MPSMREAGLRHIRHYTERAHRAGDMYTSGNQPEGLALFDQDREQIDGGWRWLQQQLPADDTDTIVLHLVNALIFIGALRYDPRHDHIPQLETLLAAVRRLKDRYAEGATLGNLGVVYNDLDCCVLGVGHTRGSRWLQHALLGEQVGKHRFGGLSVHEAFMHIQHQLLDQRLGLLTARFPDGFDGAAPFCR